MAADQRGDQSPGTDQVGRFLSNPAEYFGHSQTRMLSEQDESLEILQLAALKRRFQQLRFTLPMLQRLADSQGIDAVENLDDVVPVLFDHATYKSYPASLIEKRQFAKLTAWLGKLTTIDLNTVDVTACKTIDDWIITLDRETDLAVTHSSGTAGTLSFLPWSKRDWRVDVDQYLVLFFQTFGDDASAAGAKPLNIPCIYPFFRSGASAHTRVNDYIVAAVAGDESRFHAAYPGRLSADLLRLAAQRRGAIAKGQLDSLSISPELDERREEFERQQRSMPQHAANFFHNLHEVLAGQRIFLLATSNLLYSLAERGLAQGVRGIFDPDSVIVTGGGGKGMVLPDNWQAVVKEFFGVDRLRMGYGMSEMAVQFPMCSHERYHCPPSVIPYVLDPDSGAPLPRTGTRTGRFAFYDLVPDTRWGGFVTGDEVTIAWDQPCACGRKGPYLHSSIQRLSEKRAQDGGDEKISCASTPAAYEEALEFLNGTAD